MRARDDMVTQPETCFLRRGVGVTSGAMKILGKSRGVASVIAIAFGLSVATIPASDAHAQIAPTGLPTPPPPPASQPAKPAPAAPAAQPAGAAPAKPAAPATGAAPVAPAKPADPKALLASGEKKFKAADYAGALSDFEASNTAKASPEADRFIGQSHDNLGHFPEAVVAYERFLAKVPANMKAQGEETTKRVEAIKAMPAKVHVETTPAGAKIFVDPPASGAAGAPAPVPEAATTPTDLELKPGKHTIRVQAEGYTPVDKEIEAAYGSKQDVRVELSKNEPPPPPPPPVIAETPSQQPTPPPPPPPEPRSKVPAYVTGAVAIVATGVGIGFGIKALSQSSDFDKNPTTKKADDGENNALVADMMFGIAITFGVTSAVLFLSSDAPQTAKGTPQKNAPQQATASERAPRKAAPDRAKVTITPAPYITPTGGGAGALVRF